jgi:hypothetical protein
MTQATRVHSTPPTNTPVDTTRRRLLSAVAGGAVAGLISTAVLAPAPAVDPIFEVIEGSRRICGCIRRKPAAARSCRQHRREWN